jgi:hypothetical protein
MAELPGNCAMVTQSDMEVVGMQIDSSIDHRAKEANQSIGCAIESQIEGGRVLSIALLRPAS